jgi:hypothetical protein
MCVYEFNTSGGSRDSRGSILAVAQLPLSPDALSLAL